MIGILKWEQRAWPLFIIIAECRYYWVPAHRSTWSDSMAQWFVNIDSKETWFFSFNYRKHKTMGSCVSDSIRMSSTNGKYIYFSDFFSLIFSVVFVSVSNKMYEMFAYHVPIYQWTRRIGNEWDRCYIFAHAMTSSGMWISDDIWLLSDVRRPIRYIKSNTIGATFRWRLYLNRGQRMCLLNSATQMKNKMKNVMRDCKSNLEHRIVKMSASHRCSMNINAQIARLCVAVRSCSPAFMPARQQQFTIYWQRSYFMRRFWY